METPTWIARGFKISGLVNIAGVLLASHAFTATAALSKYDPGAFGVLGLSCIILWGLAYIASAEKVGAMPLLALVFCIEKLVYTANWLYWLKNSRQQLGEIYEAGFLQGLFYSVYGLNDLLFFVFFGIAFMKLRGGASS